VVRIPAQLRSNTVTAAAMIVLFGVVIAVLGREWSEELLRESGIKSTLAALPGYAAQSLLRMLAAYVLCVGIALTVGGLMARDERAARIILPLLDIGQSVPVLGFFPIVVLLLLDFFHGSRLGVELSAVFLLVTCQLWNLIFGVYEALATIPRDLEQAARSIGLSGGLLFRRLHLPVTMPRLIYNSILSWANSWYFLIAVEIITLGPRNYRLPGLGSYLMTTAAEGKPVQLAIGLAVLVGIVVALDFFVWRPLTLWAERFKYDVGGGQLLPTEARFRFAFSDWLDPARLGRLQKPVQFVWAPADWAVRGILFVLSGLLALVARPVHSPVVRRVGRLLAYLLPTLLLGFVGYAGFRGLLWISANPLPGEATSIPKALLFSALRVFLALAIALAWAVPMAVYLFHHPKRARFWVPAFQIMASIPVTALFPVLTALLLRFSWGMEMTSILLLLTGMQWYLLFNVLAGVSQIPEELEQSLRSMGADEKLYWRKLLLPAMLPSLVTGCLAAWGGGWNAIILSEYMVYGEKRYYVDGLGSMLKRATLTQGDMGLLVVTLAVMVGFILLVNRVLWRPAYEYATRRFRMEF
jgi:NitT/TauT family transport system permease protein